MISGQGPKGEPIVSLDNKWFISAIDALKDEQKRHKQTKQELYKMSRLLNDLNKEYRTLYNKKNKSDQKIRALTKKMTILEDLANAEWVRV